MEEDFPASHVVLRLSLWLRDGPSVAARGDVPYASWKAAPSSDIYEREVCSESIMESLARLYGFDSGEREL